MMDLDKVLKKLHGSLADQLLAKVKSGEATASEHNVARQFLKDNGIEAIAKPTNGLGELADILPFNEEKYKTQGE